MIWGPVIEKAWAKVKGAYLNADGGMSANALRFMTNAPAPTYDITDTFLESEMNLAFKMIEDSLSKGYLVNFGTRGTDDKV